MDYASFLKSAAQVVPSERQLRWYNTEFYAFVHFTVNTYTDLEWGMGSESPAIFNPTELDCDQWVAAIKECGMKGLILTAKHHDGFCLWPSAYTEHSVKNSPLKRDVVKEAAEVCKKGGIGFGVYLSPWDRNSALYGTDAYNDYYRAQLTELCTQYGDLFMVWFDGACGEGPNGKQQVYDFDSYINIIRKHQPNTVIFNDRGPDVRWIGNESGTGRRAEWAVVPRELAAFSNAQTGAGPISGQLTHIYNTQESLGDLDIIAYSNGLCFCGAEVDMSIRPGWFYHANEQPHSVGKLMDAYLQSIGHNACFNLNIPPMPNGKFDPRDVARLREFSAALDVAFGNPLTFDTVRSPLSPTQSAYTMKFNAPVSLKYITLCEDIRLGQRVAAFIIEAQDEFGLWRTIYDGATIGHKQICAVIDKNPAITYRVTITSSRDVVENLEIAAYV